MLASLVCGLIKEKRIRTTLAKAKETRRMAERMVTVGRTAAQPGRALAARRRAIALLRHEEPVRRLLEDIVPKFEGRNGGYTRILKLGRRRSDGAEMALLEWVGIEVPDKRRKKKVETKPEGT